MLTEGMRGAIVTVLPLLLGFAPKFIATRLRQ